MGRRVATVGTMSIRLAANISMLFREHGFADRITAAADAGFPAVECQFPYEVEADVLAARLAQAGVPMIGLNTTPGDRFGSAAVPGLEARFREDFQLALRYAQAMDTRAIHVMSGVPDAPRDAARETFLANLRWAAEVAPADMTLLIEPLNSRDRPGYFVSRSDEVVELLTDLACPNVKVMFDIYHVQIMEGDLITRLARHFDHIGHVQIASVQGRHEPDEGEICLDGVFTALEAQGWGGYVGAEYNPRGDTVGGLGWAEPWLAR